MNTFENLEKLNAQIDIWIDEEEYKKVHQALPVTNDKLRKNVDSCFKDPNCTENKDSNWQTILPRDCSLPIEKAYPPDAEGDGISLDKNDNHWSPLFYAKTLRARIQDRGSDHYLDDGSAMALIGLSKSLPILMER